MIIPCGVIRCSVISFLVLFSSAINNHGAASDYENEFVTATQVVVVEGAIAKLPCDISPSLPGDKIHIVIWFKKSNKGKLTPIYTFDSRDNLLLQHGKHWSDELILGGRVHFRFQDEPAKLAIDSILHNDAGLYQCRVDFKQSPTRYSEVNLTVIIPPKELTILDEKGFRVTDYVLGPYNEGSSINITCICSGGFPTPKLTWWKENALLDDSYEYLSSNIVRNVLHIEQLQRKHLHMALTCQASNNDVVVPISTSMLLDINLRPLSIKLLGENKPLSVGRTYQLKCEVTGSRPIPIITWWKGSTNMSNVPAVVNTYGNVTISTVNFTPSLDDEGKYISCTAEQPEIPANIIESGWKLNIYYVPLISLGLGNNKTGNTFKEGSDVHFECNIKSNPWVYKVSWKYNGKMLFNNITEGIIINNQSLVLQDVSRDRAGIYICIGSNIEGDGESSPVRLEIIFAPVCRSKQFVTYHVALHETVQINCNVEANPAPIEFIWKFNNTEISPHLISSHQTSSTMSYTPTTERDYGALFCLAVNAVGDQNDPCVYRVTFIDKPRSLSNCSLLNQTHQSLLVKCAASLDSGLNQTFVAEVYEIQTHRLLKNLSSERPMFSIEGLSQGLEIDINLYVASEKAKSQVTRLTAFIPKLEETLADVLLPPENCSVTSHTHYHLRIKCQVSEIQRRKSLTYLLQVYDANSHTLVGTSTSQSPEAITVTALPRDCHDLLLFIRGIDEYSVTSDAATLYVPAGAKTSSLININHASASLRFYITPTLAITISVVFIIIFATVVILAVCHSCRRSKYNEKKSNEGDNENKNHDIVPLKNGKNQEEGFIDEMLCIGPSETYIKGEVPDEINVKRAVLQPLLVNRYRPPLSPQQIKITQL